MTAELAPRMRTMLKMFGPGPEGRNCKHCHHFIIKEWDKHYFKCELNKDTGGPASDWRASWPACGKFVANPNFSAAQACHSPHTNGGGGVS